MFSGPINVDDNTCATTCTESAKFSYEVGQTYSFVYEADTVTSLQGATEEHSSLHVRSAADIHVLSPCEFALTVSTNSFLKYFLYFSRLKSGGIQYF